MTDDRSHDSTPDDHTPYQRPRDESSASSQDTGRDRGAPPESWWHHQGSQPSPQQQRPAGDQDRWGGYYVPPRQVPAGYPTAPQQPYPGGAPQGPQGGGTATATKPRRTNLVVGALALALVAGGIGGGAVAALDKGGSRTVTTSLSQTAQAQPAATAPAGTVQQVAATVLPSVVQITVVTGNSGGEGSGIILSSDGLIMTNNHVVESAANGGSITVTFNDGTTTTGTIVGRDPSADIAVIKADNKSGLTPIQLGSSSNLAVGQDVVAVGSPLGLAGTVTSGIVSSLNRPVSAGGEGTGQTTVLDAIQTDAAINPGNSGGALVNMSGQLVGINSAIASLSSSSSSASGQSGSIGLGFAIPVDQARRIAQELIDTGTATQAVLGVSVASSTSAIPTTSGATVSQVVAGGAAEKAGITAGSVITKIDDRVIQDGDSLVAAVRSHAPGDTVTLTVAGANGSNPRTVQVTLDGQTVGTK
ncbi:trypsin-like peptidase domain-containing protein [Rhodococcus aerolatus]